MSSGGSQGPDSRNRNLNLLLEASALPRSHWNSRCRCRSWRRRSPKVAGHSLPPVPVGPNGQALVTWRLSPARGRICPATFRTDVALEDLALAPRAIETGKTLVLRQSGAAGRDGNKPSVRRYCSTPSSPPVWSRWSLRGSRLESSRWRGRSFGTEPFDQPKPGPALCHCGANRRSDQQCPNAPGVSETQNGDRLESGWASDQLDD